MNRENKRKSFEKGYYKTHPCRDSFTCRVCGWPVGPQAAGTMDLTQEMADAIFTPAES